MAFPLEVYSCVFSTWICLSLFPSVSWSSCSHLCHLSSALSASCPSTVFLSLSPPLSLLSFPSRPRSSLERGTAWGPERRPEACWGSGVMVHVLLCTDRQAQDRSFRQSRPHNPSLKHRNRQGNHWHTRHSKDEGQRGVDPIHPLTR